MKPVTTLQGLAERAVKVFGCCNGGGQPLDDGEGVEPIVSLQYQPPGRCEPALWRATVVLVEGHVEVGAYGASSADAIKGACGQLEWHARFVREVVCCLATDGVTDLDGVTEGDHCAAQQRAKAYWADQREAITSGGVR